MLPATVGDTDAKAMSSLLVIGPAKGNRIRQILSAINYRFLGPEFSLGLCRAPSLPANRATPKSSYEASSRSSSHCIKQSSMPRARNCGSVSPRRPSLPTTITTSLSSVLGRTSALRTASSRQPPPPTASACASSEAPAFPTQRRSYSAPVNRLASFAYLQRTFSGGQRFRHSSQLPQSARRRHCRPGAAADLSFVPCQQSSGLAAKNHERPNSP